jgi:hyperosmotically inducible periplasmic protein
MRFRAHLTTGLLATTLLVIGGCAVTRGQESVGAYVDDSAITTAVKARFVDSRQVDAAAISVETMKGTVMLSGFAKSTLERTTAEALTRKVNGVTAVKNEIAVRP